MDRSMQRAWRAVTDQKCWRIFKMSTQFGYDSAAWDLDRIREDAWTKLERARLFFVLV